MPRKTKAELEERVANLVDVQDELRVKYRREQDRSEELEKELKRLKDIELRAERLSGRIQGLAFSKFFECEMTDELKHSLIERLFKDWDQSGMMF